MSGTPHEKADLRASIRAARRARAERAEAELAHEADLAVESGSDSVGHGATEAPPGAAGRPGSRTLPGAARSAAEALNAHASALIGELRPAAVVGYAALPGEPSVNAALEDAARRLPVLLPATRKGEALRLGRLHGRIAELPAKIWGIREPDEAAPAGEALARIPGSGPILVLVPGLAYDARGVRLGNGGGFYDRTFGPVGDLTEDGGSATAPVLSRLQFVGVCWDGERTASLPREDWDLVVSAALTETGLHETRSA